ncbi:quinoprotein dehydrogenase-associated SoxYZ-like carrier, partial [Geminicoccus flavidas]|uniref:quinoprotein dehydrogenase-associated SoxYZ-like carrier n=1 Tax=Geminicoccus flavidas TaxID=2506407 RepID=UPI001357FC91
AGAGLMLALFLAIASPVLAAGGTESEREERWQDLRQSIFGERPIEDGAGLITLEAPARALDAALVPITIRITPEHRDRVAAVHLVIDDNPSPYAAKANFGPAGDPAVLRLRVRIDGYTNVHAVAETKNGQLYATAAFVKASGGCSAPIGVSDEVAMQGMGQMKLRPAGPDTQGEAT